MACMGYRRNACRVLVGRFEGKTPLRRSRPRWEDNITMDFQEVRWVVVGWVDVAQNTVRYRDRVKEVMDLRVA